MTNNKGLDFINRVRTNPDKELGVKVRDAIGLGGTVIFTLGSWMGSCLYGLEANIDLLPGNDINHNGYWDGEVWYQLGYMVGFPAVAAAASFGLGWLVGKGVEKTAPLLRGPNEADKNFQEVYDSLVELVKSDDNFRTTAEFRSLQPEYRDALRIDGLAEKLTKGRVADVQVIRDELEGSESKSYAGSLVGRYLEELPVEQLPQYDALLREDELVRMAESYVREGKLSETERLTEDGRFSDDKRDEVLGKVSDRYIEGSNLEDAEKIARDKRVFDGTRVSLLNRIAQFHLNDGNLQRAEDLWRTTENYDMLKGPLLQAYKAGGNNRKVAELFALRI